MNVDISNKLENKIKDCLLEYADSTNEANMPEGFFKAMGLLEMVYAAIKESNAKYEEHIQELIDRN